MIFIYNNAPGCSSIEDILDHCPAAPRVLSFSLIDADTDQPIHPLREGAVLNLAQLPKNLNVRATTNPALVGSVVLILAGNQHRRQVDNQAPYALYGDRQGDYNPWKPKVGSYTLTANTYTGSRATGTTENALTVSFRVVSQLAPARLTTQEAAQEPTEKLVVYPNPFRESFTLELGTQPVGPVGLFDGAGRQVFEQPVVESRQRIQPSSDLVPGIYLLQVGEGQMPGVGSC